MPMDSQGYTILGTPSKAVATPSSAIDTSAKTTTDSQGYTVLGKPAASTPAAPVKPVYQSPASSDLKSFIQTGAAPGAVRPSQSLPNNFVNSLPEATGANAISDQILKMGFGQGSSKISPTPTGTKAGAPVSTYDPAYDSTSKNFIPELPKAGAQTLVDTASGILGRVALQVRQAFGGSGEPIKADPKVAKALGIDTPPPIQSYSKNVQQDLNSGMPAWQAVLKQTPNVIFDVIAIAGSVMDTAGGSKEVSLVKGETMTPRTSGLAGETVPEGPGLVKSNGPIQTLPDNLKPVYMPISEANPAGAEIHYSLEGKPGYNPENPTFMKFSQAPDGLGVVPEIVQIKPSILNTDIGKLFDQLGKPVTDIPASAETVVDAGPPMSQNQIQLLKGQPEGFRPSELTPTEQLAVGAGGNVKPFSPSEQSNLSTVDQIQQMGGKSGTALLTGDAAVQAAAKEGKSFPSGLTVKPLGFQPPQGSTIDQIKNQNPEYHFPTPKTPKEGTMLASGFNPGVDKFIAEEGSAIKEKATEAASTISQTVNMIKKSIISGIDQGAYVSKTVGPEAYSSAIGMKTRSNVETEKFNMAKSETLNKNFDAVEKWFGSLSSKDIRLFNEARGEAQTPGGIKLQAQARANLPKHLQDPKLMQAVNEAADYAHNLAVSNGLELGYVKDYFRGSFKGGQATQSKLDKYFSSDSFTKEKKILTVADAHAMGIELKNNNPISNIKSEIVTISNNVAMHQLSIQGLDQGWNVETNKAPDEWVKVNDEAFQGMRTQPDMAKLIDNLQSTNKISQNIGLKGLRGLIHTVQIVKFAGSVFHMGNMAKETVALANLGPFNPKGYANVLKAFNPLDKKDPMYLTWVSDGGNASQNQEIQTIELFNKMMDKIGRGNFIGGANKLAQAGLSIPIPGSPGFVKWMFEQYIPALKFEAYKIQNADQSFKIGRPLSKAERIDIVRNVQNFYGEMNESLFGRSGTVTSIMRFFFNAPGYAEGNLRNTLNAIIASGKMTGKLFTASGKALTGNVEGAKQDWQKTKETYATSRKSITSIVWSLVSIYILAQIATRINTGKWKKPPTGFNNTIRDQYKIQTGQNDGRGNEIMYDLMTYEKDPYMIFGNLAEKQPGQIPPELLSRLTGLASTPFKATADFSELLAGQQVVDWKGSPIYYSTDTAWEKTQKMMVYEAIKGNPIAWDTFQQSLKKGISLKEAGILALVGIRATNSEQIKEVLKVQTDFFSLVKSVKPKASALSKLQSENPAEFQKEKAAFNKQQVDKLTSIMAKVGETPTQYMKTQVQVIKVYPYRAQEGSTVRGLLNH
jgi:hypothetical protein